MKPNRTKEEHEILRVSKLFQRKQQVKESDTNQRNRR
jgi:hypothetical protein